MYVKLVVCQGMKRGKPVVVRQIVYYRAWTRLLTGGLRVGVLPNVEVLAWPSNGSEVRSGMLGGGAERGRETRSGGCRMALRRCRLTVSGTSSWLPGDGTGVDELEPEVTVYCDDVRGGTCIVSRERGRREEERGDIWGEEMRSITRSTAETRSGRASCCEYSKGW